MQAEKHAVTKCVRVRNAAIVSVGTAGSVVVNLFPDAEVAVQVLPAHPHRAVRVAVQVVALHRVQAVVRHPALPVPQVRVVVRALARVHPQVRLVVAMAAVVAVHHRVQAVVRRRVPVLRVAQVVPAVLPRAAAAVIRTTFVTPIHARIVSNVLLMLRQIPGIGATPVQQTKNAVAENVSRNVM